MADEIYEYEDDVEPVPFTTRAGVFAGSMATAGIIDLAGHLGGFGMVGGAFLAVLLTAHTPEIVALRKKLLPHLPESLSTFGKRLNNRLGQNQEEREPAGEQDDTLYEGAHDQMLLQQVPTGPSFFKRFPQNETMYLGQLVATGQRFDPHIDWMLGDGGIIAGQPGAGKSNLIGLMAAGAGRCGMATIVIDYKREFYTLGQVVEGFCWAGHPSFAAEAGESYYALTGETAADLADIVMSYHFLTVIDVPSYAGRANDLAEALTALFNALMDQAQQQAESDRLPCLIFVDEAHNFWPEERKLSAFSTMKKESFDALQSAHNRIVTGGRSYGFTMIVATQRIANIAKWAIAPLQVKVIMRHRELNDLKRCKEDAGEADQKVITTLAPGQGIVIGLTDDPVVVQFDRQPARHVSVTPRIERVHAKRALQAPPRFSQVVAGREQGREPLLNQARHVFEPGVSHHDLARLLGTDTETAIELFKLLKRASVSTVSAQGNAGNDLETGPETQPEARSRVITGIFENVSTSVQETEALRGEIDTMTVSNEIRETIRRGRSMKPVLPHRTIANMVGLGGRSYKIYQHVCREMGLMSAAEAAEQ